jgi:hypothetical protein
VKKQNKKTNRTLRPFIFISVITLILIVVYSVTKPDEYVTPIAPATGQLIENRPVMSSAFYTGKTAEAYRIAAEIPKIIDSQFCYCYCKKNHQHKTLLTCFTNKHGSKCDTCINEVLYAYELYKQGKTLDEIIVSVDKKFYRPYKPQRL